MNHSVLIVEDDVAMAQLLVEGLTRRGYRPVATSNAEQALAALGQRAFDAVVTDVNMKGLSGLALCGRIVQGHPGVPVLVITAFGSMDTAIQAIRAGAYDFLTKPFELEALSLALNRAIAHKELGEEVKRLKDEAGSRKAISPLLGESAAMRELAQLVGRVADSESAVAISGERGAGKSLVARTLHDASRRKDGPFVSISCSGVADAVLSLELLGSPATKSEPARPSAFARALRGTLYLSDVDELSAAMQGHLHQALQQQAGAQVRLVTSSKKDLELLAEQGAFRHDLLLSLNVVELHVPPLRLRGNDVLLLAQHFVRHFAEKSGRAVTGLASSAAEKLLGYAWPLNVRELRTVIERAVALTRYAQLTSEDLPEKVLHLTPATSALETDESVLVPMEEVEKRHILRVLRAVGGHRTQAAKVLGLDRKTLYRKLESYGPLEVEAALRDAPPRQLAVAEG